jgi:hypothetical protein
MSPAVCLLPAPSANHRIDTISQIDNNDRTTPVQQAPRQGREFREQLKKKGNREVPGNGQS